MKNSKSNHIIIAGDFDAPLRAWAYNNDSKSIYLISVIDSMEIELSTNCSQPTRLGNSVSKDSYPDLTPIKEAKNYVSKTQGKPSAAVTTC